MKRLAEYVNIDLLPDFLGGKETTPLLESPGPWKTAIEESRNAKTLLLVDRAPEVKYFRVACDPESCNKNPSNSDIKISELLNYEKVKICYY